MVASGALSERAARDAIDYRTLALHPDRNNDDYRRVTFLAEATRPADLIVVDQTYDTKGFLQDDAPLSIRQTDFFGFSEGFSLRRLHLSWGSEKQGARSFANASAAASAFAPGRPAFSCACCLLV